MTTTRCAHASPVVVHNAVGEPVRLVCACGRNWRVLPIEWDVQVTTVASLAGHRSGADVLREAARDLLACHYEKSRVSVATFADWLTQRADLRDPGGAA